MKCSLPFILAAGLLAAPFFLQGAPADNPLLHRFTSGAGATFELSDPLRLPALAWPRTLVGYPVDFSAAAVSPDALCLRNALAGRDLPFQLSRVRTNAAGRLQFAFVYFVADLPSGGSRRFELLARTNALPAFPAGVSQTLESNRLILDTGRLKVALPRSQEFAPGDPIPGPLLALNRGNGWMGDARIVSPTRAVQSVTTEWVESGPLFLSVRMTYRFAGGGSYSATVRAVADYDFVALDEVVTGLAKPDGVYCENAWTAFHPTHRMTVGSPFGGTRAIDDPMMQPFRGEDPAFTGPSRREDPAVEMLPSLTPYWPNGWGGNRSAAFWDAQSGDALGLFITDAARWQDHEYALWTSADTLKVKYRYAGGTLYWKWPLVTGTRATGITAYRHGKTGSLAPLADQTPGATWQEETEGAAAERERPEILRTQYADISLDRVKDWVLTYPDTAASPPTNTFASGRQKTVAGYFKALADCAAVGVAKGQFHPVNLRDVSYWVIPDYLRFRAAMNPAQRAQAEAVLLFTAYVAAEEEFAPMQTMLGGHPNFMADLKFPLAGAAFLFPQHPLAGEWRDQFEKFMELAGDFYVRPAVPAWGALPGRWTESIATYNWAFLHPTVTANQLSLQSGGRNCFATPQLADMGDYLVGILTSPQMLDAARTNWPADLPLTETNGFRRIHPPQGAHSGKRGADGMMHTLGGELLYYRPLTAEHLLWATAPTAGRSPGKSAAPPPAGKINRGTNPHLTSAKYNGYGIVLRAGVDTPEEVAVYLQQIDKGPNYRWGYANQNGSGDIYFYAGGKSYSGHGFEDTGDRHGDDAFYTCNTGVYKNYHYSCIGMNELTRPFYNLDTAQFAEIVPASGDGAYAWPEFQSRSVLLVGTDYFITYDAILEPCGTRFTWNSAGVNDELPFIHPIKGGGENVLQTASLTRDHQRGVVYDAWKGAGDRMMLITHRPEVKVIPEKKSPFVRVKTAAGEDCVFQDSKEISYESGDTQFHGRAGVVRQRGAGRTELALFHGSQIGAAGVTLAVDTSDLGLSAGFTTPVEITGRCFSPAGGTLTLKVAGTGQFYLDGSALVAGAPGVYRLPGGDHHWQWTAGLPELLSPRILRTENGRGNSMVFFTAVSGADRNRIELSRDGGQTWQPAGETAEAKFLVGGLVPGEKVHVRVLAGNREHVSPPSDEYPVYVTDQAPRPPDGLKAYPGSQEVRLAWGEVLGITEFRLYRRLRGGDRWQIVYHGRSPGFLDRVIGVTPPYDQPGLQAAAGRGEVAGPVYEYAVAAVDGNGEGEKSQPADTDPASWRTWLPDTDLRFKRQTAFWLPPYVEAKDVPPRHYPE